MSNDAAVYFEQWTASGGDDVVGSASFEAWTAEAQSTPGTSPAFEAWTSAGFSAPGAHGTATFREWQAEGASHSTPFGTGAASFEPWTATGYERWHGAGTIEVWSSTGYSRGVVVGSAAFEAWKSNQNSGFPSFSPWVSEARSRGALAETYSGRVMNARTGAMTEYTNYEFNSFAKIGGRDYGAGPNGLFRLDGDTDDGANIAWIVRTGQHDDKDPGLKRLPEVLLALRSSGQVKVRVYHDDNKYYDYILPALQTNTIHQHRVVPGKGMRGRYFAVELQGVNNSDLELDSAQINMTETTRRLG